jgi:thymidylate synthase
MIRDGQLSCRYYIRSCDLVRHFTDDVYMAGRLTQWVADGVNKSWYTGESEGNHIKPGRMTMYIASLHAFTGDAYKLKQMEARAIDAKSDQ